MGACGPMLVYWCKWAHVGASGRKWAQVGARGCKGCARERKWTQVGICPSSFALCPLHFALCPFWDWDWGWGWGCKWTQVDANKEAQWAQWVGAKGSRGPKGAQGAHAVGARDVLNGRSGLKGAQEE